MNCQRKGMSRSGVPRCGTGKRIADRSAKSGLGAQFGGKYFAHDIRVIRLHVTAHPARSVWASPVLLTVNQSEDQPSGDLDRKTGT